MSAAVLGKVLEGIAWTEASDRDYVARFPDAYTDWSLVTKCEILVPLNGLSASVNWTEGGTCEWCGRAVGFCPGHHPNGLLVTAAP